MLQQACRWSSDVAGKLPAKTQPRVRQPHPSSVSLSLRVVLSDNDTWIGGSSSCGISDSALWRLSALGGIKCFANRALAVSHTQEALMAYWVPGSLVRLATSTTEIEANRYWSAAISARVLRGRAEPPGTIVANAADAGVSVLCSLVDYPLCSATNEPVFSDRSNFKPDRLSRRRRRRRHRNPRDPNRRGREEH